MKYLLLIYENEDLTAQHTEAEQQQEMAAWFRYTEAMQQAKVMVAGEALKPISTATTVRKRDGKTVHTDGPFAETREQLGGFYVLDVPDLEQALDWAAKAPNAGRGSLEVRPIVDFASMR